MAKTISKKRKSLLKLIKTAFSDLEQCEKVDLKDTYKLPKKKIMFPLENYPLEIHVGLDAHVLHLYPELPLADQQDNFSEPNYILFDPDSYYSRISGFYRISDDDKITLGSENAEQYAFLNTSKKLPQQQLSIANYDGKLTFKCHYPETGSCITPLLKEKKLQKINKWRREKVTRLAEILGDPLKLLSTDDALKLIQKVNGIINHDMYREKNNNDKPGGVLTIPDKMNPIIIGDLHTQMDNLLTLLSQNNFLSALENGDACLIFLGDAVHPEIAGKYDKMESSMLIMDIIFKLIVRFPKHVFYLMGNHDSFSEEIGKKGVPQGLLWEKQLKKSRGKSYRKEMQQFYDNLPYLAYSKHFICCHAGPPTSAVNLHALVNIHKHPKLVKDLISRRLQTSNRMSGYNKSDIKKLRRCLNVGENTPFIVGHTPMDDEETLWENVGGISGHTIVYGGNLEKVGVIVQIGKSMYSLTYPVEPLTKLVSIEAKK
ncbi:MAG: metallophosphoesterase [gamma proteobacterium symbiont of Bathyaustriella thionipta]|nr:metallophosphoesterase [gamma proteobacterium symbiont of Bathyaustriella thionipta]MCU7954843.1 metallophosphoesterase [gamma proteobacterium symbiont of Bathyaustriella thionipta]MCU7956954.1 metallophosphoesterase [gamma proteobacterium symbiont of Bathyaustriella thionipta]MCU7967426.1 metallophosphoesterase [gamma proteobacterium symbiont of Bathyaustriella thionipta]